MKNENIYQTPDTHTEYVDLVTSWSGKKLLLVTSLPSLIMIITTLFVIVFRNFLFRIDNTGYIVLIPTLITAITCSIWTACHVVSTKNGNWVDKVGYSFMWSVIQAMFLFTTFLVSMFFFGILFSY